MRTQSRAKNVGYARRRSYAIVMGDLVRSQDASAPRELHRQFNEAVEEANRAFAASIASPLTITLGDEFQGLCNTLTGGLEIVRHLRLRLLSTQVECRFVLGHTELDSPLNRNKAWNMMGSGFSGARDTLNNKDDPNAYRFSFPEAPVHESLMNAIGASLTLIENGWTETQLEYVQYFEKAELSTKAIAKKAGVSTSSVYKVLRAANSDLYKRQHEALSVGAGDLDRSWKLNK